MTYFPFVREDFYLGFRFSMFLTIFVYFSCQRLRYVCLKVSHKYCISSILFLTFLTYFVVVTERSQLLDFYCGLYLCSI